MGHRRPSGGAPRCWWRSGRAKARAGWPSKWRTPTTWCARPRCRYRGANRCRGRREWRAAAARWSRSSISTRWETASDDGGRRRPARHVQGGRPGLRLQHLPGGAHPPLRGTGAVAQGPRLSGGGAPIPGSRHPPGGSAEAARRPAPHREETRSVILEWEGGKLGVVVDAVTEVRQVAAEQITAPPGIVKGLAAAYITGLVVTDGRTIIVLNTARLLSGQEKVALEAAVQPQAKA